MQDIVRQNLEAGKIYVVGEIDESTYLAFAHKINYIINNSANSANSAIKDIYVFLHTIGGDLESALAIIDEINIAKNKGYTIHTIATGKCLSAGALILVYGDIRYVTENVSIMVHQISYELPEGTHRTSKAYVAFADKINDSVWTCMALRCGRKNSKAIRQFIESLRDDLWLSADEAIDQGLVDKKWE